MTCENISWELARQRLSIYFPVAESAVLEPDYICQELAKVGYTVNLQQLVLPRQMHDEEMWEFMGGPECFPKGDAEVVAIFDFCFPTLGPFRMPASELFEFIEASNERFAPDAAFTSDAIIFSDACLFVYHHSEYWQSFVRQKWL